MTEQPDGQRRPSAEEAPQPAVPGDGTAVPDHVRTQGETAVDEAMGTGDNVH